MRFTSFVAILMLCFAQAPLARADQPSSYVKSGMPSPSRVWLGEDYAQAVSVLKTHAAPLPRFSDTEGAAIMNRMTATENLDHCRNPGNAATTWQSCLEIAANLQDLFGLYAAAPGEAQAQSVPEVAALGAYSLRFTAIGLGWASQARLAQPDNPALATHIAKNEARAALAFFEFVGAISSQDEGFAADRSVTLAALSDTLPTFNRLFSADDKQELVFKLAVARKKMAGVQDRARIDAMVIALGGKRDKGQAASAVARVDQASSYVLAGMPSPSRLWDAHDYADALSVLKRNAAPLPRFSDAEGAAILNHITALDNRDPCHDRTKEVWARYKSCHGIRRSVGGMVDLYVAALPRQHKAPPVAAPELVALATYELRIRGVLVAVRNDILLAEPSNENLAKKKTEEDALTVRSFFNYMRLVDAREMAAGDRSMLLAAASDVLPEYKSLLSGEERQLLADKLMIIRPEFDAEEDRTRIDSMLMALRVEADQPWKLQSPPQRTIQPQPAMSPELVRRQITGEEWWSKLVRAPATPKTD